jgi:nitrogen fixation NifU-like protein
MNGVWRESSSAKVVERCRRPRNAGSFPPGEPGVGTGTAGEAAKGDLVRIQLRFVEGGRIEEARFKVFGCGSSIACASLAAEWATGRTLGEALEIRNDDIARELELPEEKIHCSVLAEDALRAAVEDFLDRGEAQGKTTSGGKG